MALQKDQKCHLEHLEWHLEKDQHLEWHLEKERGTDVRGMRTTHPSSDMLGCVVYPHVDHAKHRNNYFLGSTNITVFFLIGTRKQVKGQS